MEKNLRGKGRGQVAAQGSLAPTARSSRNSRNECSALTNSNTTLYIFKCRGRPVAVAIGQFPPDPGSLAYDELLRIPVVHKGDTPTWQPFTWHHGQSIRAAMDRPRISTSAGGSGRGGSKPKRKRRRRNSPAPIGGTKRPEVAGAREGDAPAPARKKKGPVADLATRPDGRRYVTDPRTGEIVLEEVSR